MSFLPNNYQPPKSNHGYMKLQEGENKIRILSSCIIGWEDWDNKTPIRFRPDNKPAMSIDPKKPVKHFWSFIVWNYAEEAIQILHITQRSIQNKLHSLSEDKDWGAPYFYDIKIIKKGQGVDTEYEVNPLPHKEVSVQIEKAFDEKPCYLEALYDNADPFDKNWTRYTTAQFKRSVSENKPSASEIDEMCEILSCCTQQFQDEVKVKLGSKKIADLPKDSFDRLMKKAKEMRDANLLANEEIPF